MGIIFMIHCHPYHIYNNMTVSLQMVSLRYYIPWGWVICLLITLIMVVMSLIYVLV